MIHNIPNVHKTFSIVEIDGLINVLLEQTRLWTGNALLENSQIKSYNNYVKLADFRYSSTAQCVYHCASKSSAQYSFIEQAHGSIKLKNVAIRSLPGSQPDAVSYEHLSVLVLVVFYIIITISLLSLKRQ